MKKTLGCLRRACEDFNMLQNGDKIVVGVSGGKDSMLLLYALHLYRRYMKKDYQLEAITVDMGYKDFDPAPLTEFISSIGIKHHIVKTRIAEVVFDIRNEKNPCALCSKMRKGVLYEYAKNLGCNKAAFGHQLEDVLETLLLSLFYESKINTFKPVTYMSRRDIILIRPFIYLPENEVIAAAKKYNIPIYKNPCPANGETKREEIKKLIQNLSKTNPHIKKSLISAIKNTHNYGLWDKTYIINP